MESELYETYIKALNYASLREEVILLVFLLRPHLTSLVKEICILNMFSNTLNYIIKVCRKTLMWSGVLNKDGIRLTKTLKKKVLQIHIICIIHAELYDRKYL